MASNVSRRKRRLWALIAQAADEAAEVVRRAQLESAEQEGKALEEALRDLGFEMTLRPGSTADEANRVD